MSSDRPKKFPYIQRFVEDDCETPFPMDRLTAEQKDQLEKILEKVYYHHDGSLDAEQEFEEFWMDIEEDED